MAFKTYTELKTLLKQELDLESESFIQDAELLDYFNRAIKEAEASIHKLGLQDLYFKTAGNVALVSGTATYALPSDIYMNKITGLVYNSGSRIFTINKMVGSDILLRKKLANLYPQNSDNCIYEYDLVNTSATAGTKIEFVPAPLETSATNVSIEYLRQANVLASGGDKCDIPDFYTFILSYVRWKVRDKEGHPDSENAKTDCERERQLMVETMENQVQDTNASKVQQDSSHYWEST